MELEMKNRKLEDEAKAAKAKNEVLQGEMKKLRDSSKKQSVPMSPASKKLEKQKSEFLRKLSEAEKRSEAELKAVVQKSDEEMDRLKIENESLKTEVGTKTSIIANLSDQLKRNTSKMSLFQLSCDRSELELTKVKNEMTAAVNRNDFFSQIKATLQEVLRKDAELTNSEEDDLLDSEVAELANGILLEFSDTNERHAANLRDCQEALDRLTEKKNGYKRNGLRLTKKVDELEAKVSSLGSENKDLKKQFAEKDKTIKVLGEAVKVKDKKLADSSAELGSLKRSVAAKNLALKSILQEKEITTATMQNNLKEFDLTKEELAEKVAALAELQQRTGKLQARDKQSQKEVEKLESEKKELQAKVSQLAKAVEAAAKQNDQQLLESKKAATERDRAVGAIRDFQATAAELEAQLKVKDKVIVDLQLRALRTPAAPVLLKEKEKRIKELLASEEESRVKVLALEKEVCVRGEAIDELNRNCVNLTQELTKKGQRLEDIEATNTEDRKDALELAETRTRLAKQDELVEILQWTMYMLDTKLTEQMEQRKQKKVANILRTRSIYFICRKH